MWFLDFVVFIDSNGTQLPGSMRMFLESNKKKVFILFCTSSSDFFEIFFHIVRLFNAFLFASLLSPHSTFLFLRGQEQYFFNVLFLFFFFKSHHYLFCGLGSVWKLALYKVGYISKIYFSSAWVDIVVNLSFIFWKCRQINFKVFLFVEKWSPKFFSSSGSFPLISLSSSRLLVEFNHSWCPSSYLSCEVLCCGVSCA